MKELAILVDALGWAFHFRALGFQKYLGYGDIFVYTTKEYPDLTEYKKVWQFGHHTPIRHPEKTIVQPCSITPFPHLLAAPPRALCTVSHFLRHHYKTVPCPVFIAVPFGVDVTHFKRVARQEHDRLKVAFVGNKNRPIKRYDLYAQVRDKVGDCIDFVEACQQSDRSGDYTYDGMARFYNDIDLLFNCSVSEGGPNTAFEAGACGVPTLICSQQTGIFEIGMHERDMFFVEPKVNQLCDYLLYLNNNRQLLRYVSDGVYYTIIVNHSWESVIGIWKRALEYL